MNVSQNCDSSTCLLGLVDLIAERTGGILEIVLLDSSECSKHDKLQDEVGEGAQDDKVMKASLDLAHFGGPPVGHPVDEPEEVSYESDC